MVPGGEVAGIAGHPLKPLVVHLGLEVGHLGVGARGRADE
jgi:hypothetical protein